MKKDDLFDLAKNKLYILKILELYGEDIGIKKLLHFVLENEKMNYFYCMQYVQELEKANLIQKTQDMIGLTSLGKDALNWFGNQVSQEDIQEIQAFINSPTYSEHDYEFNESQEFYMLQVMKEDILQYQLKIRKTLLPNKNSDFFEEEKEAILEDIIEVLKKER